MQNRIPKIKADRREDPKIHHRYQMMLIDEVQLLVTAGGSKPSGDEKFVNVSRAARCIPIVATQHICSLEDTIGKMWKTFVSGFATTVFLRQKDEWSASEASRMCGRTDQLQDNFGTAEGGQDAKVSLLTGRTTSQKNSMNVSHGYSISRQSVIESKTVMELPLGVALVLANTGTEQLRPTFVYLRPYGAETTAGYFDTERTPHFRSPNEN